MPLYTYQCDECGVRFDTRQKFSDDPLTDCPECGGEVHRVPQAVGIVFKGSGWYVKDSKSNNKLATPPKKDAKGDSSTDAGANKSEKSSDSSSTDKAAKSSKGDE